MEKKSQRKAYQQKKKLNMKKFSDTNKKEGTKELIEDKSNFNKEEINELLKILVNS